ncbi:lasso peptide biosynthesis protein [Bacillus cereus]|nr:lasso peptide biosynthesis protein [Bacillus cereus]MEC3260713.1 lasso peptide biosynthesis protein [Bacillus cereus]
MTTIQNRPYRLLASKVPFEHEKKEEIQKTFFVVSDYLKENPNPGACHFLSSIMYVLLKEQGIDCNLCIGEVKENNYFFDHSWVEVDGKIFDIAIQLTYDERRNPPIFASYDLGLEALTDREYGSSSPKGLDPIAEKVLNTSFGKYISQAEIKDGAWKTIKKLGRNLRLKLEVSELKERYNDTQRKLVVKEN